MSQPPDEEDDQIFSGNALSEDGALNPAQGSPRTNPAAPRPTRAPPAPVPAMPGASLLDDPAWEPGFNTTPPPAGVPARPSGLELAERAPPPMASDYVPPRPEKPSFRASSNIPWGKWSVRLVLIGALLAGTWAVVEGKIALGRFSLNILKTTSKPPSTPGTQDEEAPKRVPTPAPTLLVLSAPSGAKVFVAGAEVGVTPWAGDNVWPDQPLKVEVRMAGYKSWVGMTQGGKQATLEAELHKR
jgi:serine/threonine-protein kinase